MTPSSGNVLRDLGFSAEEAERLLFRADLLIRIRQLIALRHLSKAGAAKFLRVSQSNVRDLMRGRSDLSTDVVIDILTRFGVRVRPVLEPIRRAKTGNVFTGRPLAGMKRVSALFSESAAISISRM